MNVKEYIASGVLELYVLGSLPEQECLEVEQNAMDYPEIKAELIALEDVLLRYAQANAIPLAEGQISTILNKIDVLAAAQSPSDSATPTTPKSTGSFLPWGLLLLPLLLALGIAIYLYNQKNIAELQFLATQDTLTEQTAACDSIRTELTDAENVINILTSQATETTIIKQDGSPIYAAMYQNSEAAVAYLNASDLPAPPAGKQYQLWYIGTADPQSMGVFDLQEGLIKVEFVEQANVFAISLEDVGGSPSPTDIRYLGEVS